MKELGSLFDAFYSHFILRDVFGKIVPGATLLVALYLAIVQPSPSPTDAIRLLTQARIPTFVLLGAAGWITAFGLQRLGEFVKFLRYYGNWIQNDKSWYAELIRFAQVASPGEKAIFERFVVIKEMCGNAAVSLVLSSVLLLCPWHSGRDANIPVAILIGGVSLGFMHRVHVKRNTWWLESVLEFRGRVEHGQAYQPSSHEDHGN